MILIGHESLMETETYCAPHNWDIWSDMPTSEEWPTTRSLAGDDRADAALFAIVSRFFLGEDRQREALSYAERAARKGHPEDLLVLADLIESYSTETSRIVPLIEHQMTIRNSASSRLASEQRYIAYWAPYYYLRLNSGIFL